MDGSGEQRWSISDEVGSKVTYSTVMQALSLAWVIPSVGLVWNGFAAIGLRDLTNAEVNSSLDRIQAIVVMLSIFTLPVGCIWAFRTWRHVPGFSALGASRRWNGPEGHLVSLSVAVLAVIGLLVADRSTMALSWVAALAGCHAGLLIARWLRYAPLHRTFPAVALSAGATTQATVGWIHVINPGGRLAPLLVVEGLGLAWAAIAAARIMAGVLPINESTSAEIDAASVPAVGAGPASDTTGDLISQAPALPSLPGPAVGH